MKRVSMFSLVAAAALVAAPATFAKDCGARPTKPAIPDGKTASEDAMKDAQGKVATYIKGMNTYMTCVSGEVASAKQEATEVSNDWAAQSKIFTQTPAPAK